MTRKALKRREFMAGTAVAAVSVTTAPARAGDGPEDFAYEVVRTDDEWRGMLTDTEYFVLREFGTEEQRSSPLWNEKRPGTYCCKGCDLTIYRSLHKIELSKGWAFFRHSYPDTVMTSLDLNGGRMGDPFAEIAAAMEVHCRRCGSHLGHIVNIPEEVPGKPIHCINGHALSFQPAEA